MKNFYLNERTIPRWVILILDLAIIVFSFSLSFFILKEFRLNALFLEYFLIYLSFYCFLAIPIYYKTRLHTGLLRYSNTVDMFRIFKANLILVLLYLILMSILSFSFQYFDYFTILSITLISFFITSSLMIMMRVMAKGLFLMLVKKSDHRTPIRVLIYGSDKNAVLVKRALENNDQAHYLIEGFIDTNRALLHNYMEQKRVYHIKELKKLKKEKKIDQLIIVNEHLGERDKRVILERSLRLGIKVSTVPPVQDWLSGGLTKQHIQNLKIEDLLQRKPIEIDKTAIGDNLKGKRILVTGAAGSIGFEIAKQVLNYNPSYLILCDQAESPLHEAQLILEDETHEVPMEMAITDVRNRLRMEKLFELFKPEVVFHAAAYKHVPLMENSPFEAIDTNVHGTKNLADLSVIYGVEKFVMISTDKAVNPTNIMGASKRIAEIYVQSLNAHQEEFKNNLGITSPLKTKFITTRFGNVLGSNGSVIPRFRKQIEKGGPITVTHPEITRYFMTISEAVQLVLEAGAMGKGGEIFVFDMGKPVKIYDMAKKMIQLAGYELGKDIDIVFSGLRPGEKLYEELLNDEEVTLPTHHEKIRIAKVRTYPFEEVQHGVDQLFSLNGEQNNKKIVKQMKLIVPEFVSKNSPYEGLDQEKEIVY